MTTEIMNVEVKQPDQAVMVRNAESAIAIVQAFDIIDAPTYELAAEELTGIKRRAKELEDTRKAITKPLDDAKKRVMDLFRQPLDLLNRAESILKGKMLDYQREEERKAREAREAAERAAREERERLEAEAKKLKEEGRHGEAFARKMAAETVVAAPVPVPETPKAQGIATRTTVDFEIEDMQALVSHIAQHPELIGLVQPNTTAVRQYVRGLGIVCNLPGVRVFAKQTLAARR